MMPNTTQLNFLFGAFLIASTLYTGLQVYHILNRESAKCSCQSKQK